jgi:hypothetical protein
MNLILISGVKASKPNFCKLLEYDHQSDTVVVLELD